jgi:hypothetical protein
VEVTRNKSPLIKANNNEKKKQQDHYNSKLILIKKIVKSKISLD